MAVYVDNARLQAPHLLGGRARWSHLSADTREELEAFRQRLGLSPTWFQAHPYLWHYDVVERMRLKAIALGAEEVTPAELVERRRKADGRKP